MANGSIMRSSASGRHSAGNPGWQRTLLLF